MEGSEKSKGSPPLKLFMILYLAAALTFWLVKFIGPGGNYTFLIKVIPALTLGAAILYSPLLTGRERLFMLLGALFCGAGDVILDIDRVCLFVPGLAAFLLGHVGFLIFFLLRIERGSSRTWWTLPVFLFAVVMALLLIPKLGSLSVPVLLYLGVITAMTAAAVMARVPPVVAVGAFIFMVSDALLATAKFLTGGIPSPMVTIPVYFIGLFFLGFGVLGGMMFDPQRECLILGIETNQHQSASSRRPPSKRSTL